MKADFTRKTFNPAKNYSRVLMQQGRVQLDADFNEQAAIQSDAARQMMADIIGTHGGPPIPGFSVAPIPFATNPPDFSLNVGRYYVDGIPCNNETTRSIVTGYPDANSINVFTWTTDDVPFAVGQYIFLWDANLTTGLLPTLLQISATDYGNRKLTVTGNPTALAAFKADADNNHGIPPWHFVRRAPTYLSQADYPAPALVKNTSYQVYLDVWERVVTSFQDDSMREVALNGPDTSARAKVVAQVKVVPIAAGGTPTCPTSWELEALGQPAIRACLMARAKPAMSSTDPCVIAPDARYRGPENQLYRVEVHTPSIDATGHAAQPTFKWSRENGAVIFPIVGGGGTSVLTLDSLGRDDRFGLTEGDWVEIVDDDYELLNRAQPLRQVQSIDRVRMTVTLGGQPDTSVGTDPTKHPMLRRWDQKQGDPAQNGLTLGADGTALVYPPVKTRSMPAQVVSTGSFNIVGRDQLGVTPLLQDSPWFELEDGVQIHFVVPPNITPPLIQFRTGDYWLIPARVATADVEWPTESVADSTGKVTKVPVWMPPDGVTHHYAPLAQITVTETGIEVLHDCTVRFAPLNGALAFYQGGFPFPAPPGAAAGGVEPYSLNWAEATVVQPIQADHLEKVARPVKPPKAPKK